MNWLNNIAQAIITIGGVFSAFLVMVKFENFKYNPLTWLKNKFTDIMTRIDSQDEKFVSIEGKIDNIQEEQFNQKLDTLEIKVYLKDLPDVERYKAAQKYLELGGNHGTDIICKKLLKEYGDKVEKAESIL